MMQNDGMMKMGIAMGGVYVATQVLKIPFTYAAVGGVAYYMLM